MDKATAQDLISRFTSRKFLLAAFGVFVVFLQVVGVNISDDQRAAIIQLILAFTVAEGAADIVSRITN